MKSSKEKMTLWVVLLTAATMGVEITFGWLTHSMALLADGIHMGSHVMAIGLSWLAYVWIRHLTVQNPHGANSDQILTLSGYTSGLLLLIFALFILTEAIRRFFSPAEIQYSQALLVAVTGLLVNLISALLLHHHSEDSDHNIRAAYLHVLADALTSVAAIAGLLSAKWFNLPIIDPIVAIVSSLVIIKWALALIRQTGSALLGFKSHHTEQHNSKTNHKH